MECFWEWISLPTQHDKLRGGGAVTFVYIVRGRVPHPIWRENHADNFIVGGDKMYSSVGSGGGSCRSGGISKGFGLVRLRTCVYKKRIHIYEKIVCLFVSFLYI